MNTKKNNFPYDKRVYTKKLREPLESFQVFNLWLQHPNWTLRNLSEQTGIKYKKIREWSGKYKYFQRRADKEADEWQTINKLNLEAKIAAVQMAAARTLKFQSLLNARAEVTTGRNVEILEKYKNNTLNNEDLERTDRHTAATFKIENQALNNNILIDNIADTIILETDKENKNEFSRLTDILKESRENSTGGDKE